MDAQAYKHSVGDHCDDVALAYEIIEQLGALFDAVGREFAEYEKNTCGLPEEILSDLRPSSISSLLGIGSTMAEQWGSRFHDRMREVDGRLEKTRKSGELK